MSTADDSTPQQPVVPIEKIRELVGMVKPGNATEASKARLIRWREAHPDAPRIRLKPQPDGTPSDKTHRQY